MYTMAMELMMEEEEATKDWTLRQAALVSTCFV